MTNIYSTGNSNQYAVMTYMRKDTKKTVDICTPVTDILCIQLKLMQHYKSTIL